LQTLPLPLITRQIKVLQKFSMMPVKKVIHIETIMGLRDEEIPALQKEFGKNIFTIKGAPRLLVISVNIIKEPMFILLCFACALYFIAGEINEGFLMLVAMLFVAAISFYQEVKSFKAIEALKEYTEPKVIVIRNRIEKTIPSSELVPGDTILLEEGNKVPADAEVLQQNDLSVNESVITGESMPVTKSSTAGNNFLYQGTTINSGKCYAHIVATGNNTQLGKLGKSISGYSQPQTLLQKQIGKFVRQLAFFGFTAFIVILAVNYINSKDVINSFLFALTLAMAVIPEEIPVAFSSFMAIGAFYMAKRGIISRQPQTIENLGAVSVICLDKTGTITENKMEVKDIYDHAALSITELGVDANESGSRVLEYAMLASEKDPFDAMEKAIWEEYRRSGIRSKYEDAEMVFEYPLEGHPPVMAHVYEDGVKKIVAAKGGAEKIIEICKLDNKTSKRILNNVKYFASRGNRVIGVASSEFYKKDLPVYQDDFEWNFEGLISLHDPVKENIESTLEEFYKAGIKVKLLTGDYPETAINVAQQIKIKNADHYLTGEEVMAMDDDELNENVKNVTIFARMFPDAKLKVVEALKANGEIVAMTGDGVNDGPALKAANIGIAMGQKGTDIARQASDLVVTDDDLEKVVEAVEQGRKIFSNLKKAVRYIVSIHVPIILTASLPVLLGWKYPNIFSPIHIIFLELIMGPTCSIFFEKEPVEKNIMLRTPRDRNKALFQTGEIFLSILQGVIIAMGVLLLYYYFMYHHSLAVTRTVVFVTLIIGNIFLTFANRSFTESIFKTIRYKNSLASFIIIISLFFLALINFVPFLQSQFLLANISLKQFLICFIVAFVSVMWFEIYKMFYKML
jgi:Ca2+-transporting ATPase